MAWQSIIFTKIYKLNIKVFSKYFILISALYSFIGLSIIQGVVEFSDFSEEIEINMNIPEEEESNAPVSFETKTIKENHNSKFNRSDYFNRELVAAAAIVKDFLFLHQGYFEIFSPPPKLS